MKILIIILAFVFIAFVVFNGVNVFFRKCKHPEKLATFVRNIYGDEINYLNGRSEWKAKWWPFRLIHQYLWKD